MYCNYVQTFVGNMTNLKESLSEIQNEFEKCKQENETKQVCYMSSSFSLNRYFTRCYFRLHYSLVSVMIVWLALYNY